MKRLLDTFEALLIFLAPGFLFAIVIFAFQMAEGQSLEIVFTAEDTTKLEQLVEIAQANDLGVIEAEQELRSGEYADSTSGRVTEALSVSAGTGLSGDMYGQVAPNYSVSVSLDVMDLFKPQDTTSLSARVKAAKEAARLRTVEAFVGWKVATQSAQAASHALEAAEATLEVTTIRVDAGADVAASQLAAQSAVASAARDLLTANGQVIVAVETVSSVVGTTPERVLALLGGETVARHSP